MAAETCIPLTLHYSTSEASSFLPKEPVLQSFSTSSVALLTEALFSKHALLLAARKEALCKEGICSLKTTVVVHAAKARGAQVQHQD